MKNIKIKLLHTILIILLCLFASLSMSADFKKGEEAYQREDYAVALRELKPLSEQGHAGAQTILGLMYAYGDGVAQNHKEAVKWYRLAAEQGFAYAQYQLGTMYYFGGGVPKDNIYAYMWLNLASAQGHPFISSFKNDVFKEMTPMQFEKAQRLSRECLTKNYKNC